MKVKIDEKEVCQLSDVQKSVIANDISIDILEDDLKRRVEYILKHKYEQCFKRLKEEWDKKLVGRVEAVPTDPEAYANLVFKQPDYEDRKKRDARVKLP